MPLMIRHLIVPDEREFVIRFPDEMLGKQVEIIAFEIPEEKESEVPNRDTFLSYLQNSAFATRKLRKDEDTE
ncbi:MAG: hypothetical protein JST06_04190 [Bacteroidetes bacterium]|nr:hypothetical protein [Bacteroidota bacterium]MBS1628933.1 hypothetical protein [Bacteroidota bacterium]